MGGREGEGEIERERESETERGRRAQGIAVMGEYFHGERTTGTNLLGYLWRIGRFNLSMYVEAARGDGPKQEEIFPIRLLTGRFPPYMHSAGKGEATPF